MFLNSNSMMDKADKRIVLVLTLIYLILSFINFGDINLNHVAWVASNPNDKFFIDHTWNSGAIFDEIYYASTAYQYLHGLPPYTNVHPPLGMLLIALGISVFGMSPFGWRFIPNLASILLVPVIYILAKRIFKQRKLAVIATLLTMSEFMHFTIGRLAFLEPILTLFIAIEYYYLYCYIELRLKGIPFIATKKYLYASGLFFGLALATKLNALFSLIAILIWLIYCETIKVKPGLAQLGKLIPHLTFTFIVLPLLIYCVSYIPYANILQAPNLFSFVVDRFEYMYHFQTGLTNVTHPYASNWWSWPLLITPISIYYTANSTGIMSRSIVLIGNPAIYWFCIPSIGILFYAWWREPRNYRIIFILMAIFSQYLPFAFMHRISFLYYFYPTTPFIILAITYLIKLALAKSNKTYRYIAYTYISLNLLLFAMYFPVLSGLEIPRSYTLHVLRLLNNWNF